MPEQKKIIPLFDLIEETKKLYGKIQDREDRHGRICRRDEDDDEEPCPIASPENLVKMCTDLGLNMYFFEGSLVHGNHHFPDNTNN